MYQAVKDTSEVEHRLSVSGVLKKLGVSKSGYYDWLKRKPSKQAERREKVKKDILNIHTESKEIYGAPKITRTLREKGYCISERTVTRYMHEMGIRACYTKPYMVTTISLDFTDKLRNILNRDFSPECPNAVWCTDITYIPTAEGFLYLSCVMDLYSRKIVAWELGDTLETKHVIKAINKAILNTGSKPRVIHTDRGVQYTSDEYQEVTKDIVRSYSLPGTPWDNACIESFHALIKREWLNRFEIRDYNHAYNLIFEYINAFYNTVRIHSYCNYTSPVRYEIAYYNNNKLRITA